MALIGDVLVKFIADFGQFATGMTEATRQIGAFGKQIDEQNGVLARHSNTLAGMAKQLADLGKAGSVDQFSAKLDSLGASLARLGLIGLAAAAAIGSVVYVISKGREIEDYALGIEKLKTAYGLTTDQARAMEAMVRQTGRTADDLNKSLSTQQKTFLGDYYKAIFGDASEKIDNVAKASHRLTDAFNDLGEASKQALVSTFGDITAAALNKMADAVIGMSGAIRDVTAAANRIKPAATSEGAAAAVATAIGGGEFFTPDQGTVAANIQREQDNALYGRLGSLTERLDQYKKAWADTTKELAADGDRAGVLEAELANLAQKIANTTAELQKLAGAASAAFLGRGVFGGLGGAFDNPPGAVPDFKGAGPSILGPGQLPGMSELLRMASAANAAKTTTTGGGAGGKTDDDNVEAQIRRYKALGEAAQATSVAISKFHATNIEDFQREIKVQQQVDEIAAKLGAKYADAGDELKKQLREQIALYIEQRSANEKSLESAEKAADIERKYGDGTAQAKKSREDLDRAEKTNIATKGALARATKASQEADEQARLEATRYSDSLESFGAGITHAANAYARSNDLFSQGQQVFNGLTNAMSEGLDVLAGKSQKTFGQIASDFALMLSKMALQAATSAIFKAVFNAISLSAGSAPTSAPAGYADYSGGSFVDYWNRPRNATGGAVYAGTSYLVGEQGPERFVPTMAGQIVPMQGGGGGTNVAVNVDMSGSGGTSARQAAEFARRMKQAVLDTIQDEKRPGGTLYAGAR
jgi:hypothetical protein